MGHPPNVCAGERGTAANVAASFASAVAHLLCQHSRPWHASGHVSVCTSRHVLFADGGSAAQPLPPGFKTRGHGVRHLSCLLQKIPVQLYRLAGVRHHPGAQSLSPLYSWSVETWTKRFCGLSKVPELRQPHPVWCVSWTHLDPVCQPTAARDTPHFTTLQRLIGDQLPKQAVNLRDALPTCLTPKMTVCVW